MNLTSANILSKSLSKEKTESVCTFSSGSTSVVLFFLNAKRKLNCNINSVCICIFGIMKCQPPTSTMKFINIKLHPKILI